MVEAKDRMSRVIRDNLLKRSEKLGLSQTEIARRMKVSRQMVGHYFAGANIPNVNNLIGLARVLECTVDDLLEGCADDNT